MGLDLRCMIGLAQLFSFHFETSVLRGLGLIQKDENLP